VQLVGRSKTLAERRRSLDRRLLPHDAGGDPGDGGDDSGCFDGLNVWETRFPSGIRSARASPRKDAPFLVLYQRRSNAAPPLRPLARNLLSFLSVPLREERRMSAIDVKQPVVHEGAPPLEPELTVYGHSALFYWWPVWTVGYVLALITYLGGEHVVFNYRGVQTEVVIHPSKNLGVIFGVIVVLVVVMTNVTVRGIASLTVIIAALAVTFFFAYMGWWEDIFNWFSFLAMYMNLGFYLFFSTAAL